MEEQKEKILQEIIKTSSYLRHNLVMEDTEKVKELQNLLLNLIKALELIYDTKQKKETIDEVKKDLLDLTKGIDNDGSVYIARQLDYLDIEDLFKRYDTK